MVSTTVERPAALRPPPPRCCRPSFAPFRCARPPCTLVSVACMHSRTSCNASAATRPTLDEAPFPRSDRSALRAADAPPGRWLTLCGLFVPSVQPDQLRTLHFAHDCATPHSPAHRVRRPHGVVTQRTIAVRRLVGAACAASRMARDCALRPGATRSSRIGSVRLVVLCALVAAVVAALLPSPLLAVQAQDPCTVATCEWSVNWRACQPWNWAGCGGGGQDGDWQCNGETRTNTRTHSVRRRSRVEGDRRHSRVMSHFFADRLPAAVVVVSAQTW